MPQVYESASFHPEPVNWNSKWIVKPLLTFIVTFIAAVLLLNSPLLYIQLRYALMKHGSASMAAPLTPAADKGIGVSPTTPMSASDITIPAIGVDAPIVYESNPSENAILNALQNGVVHYPSTALPGQPGNVAIFGHSSEDWWQLGRYKFIFTLLDKLKQGNQIYITYQSHLYTYTVTDSQVVQPTDVAVLNPTATPTLTLITCTPIGTSLRRLIITATQTNPAAQQSAQVATIPATSAVTPESTLPSSPGLTVDVLNTFTTEWDKIFH